MTLDILKLAEAELAKKDTRSGFGVGLLELGRQHDNVVGLCADLTGSLKMGDFQKEFPDRFFQVGIAEANMMGVAAGLSISGKVPFTGTFANFSTGRVFDQIRQSIAYSDKNVKICASHAGLTLGEDGATHQILEDVAMMKALPNMAVVIPADYEQTRQATHAIYQYNGPVYLRFGRPKVPMFIPEDLPFEIGKAQILKPGNDVTIIANGHLVWEAVMATAELEKAGVSVELINLHTVKPFDADTVLASVRKTGAVVTAEEHQVNGGMGESVARCLVENHPAPQEFVGVNDSFGESGKPHELMEKYGIYRTNIVAKTKAVLSRKD